MAGLLFPAFQKFYSALSNLERFDKESDFFDNISCLDSFFSEYRNVTFVMQASLKHTPFFEYYEKNRDLFLKDHWFVEKRNETIKQKPFQLTKEIGITVYLPYQGFSIFEKTFSVENDTPLDSLLDELKEFFFELNDSEILFSVNYSFHEVNDENDLLKKLISGIRSMLQFMEKMESDIGEECKLCTQIKDRIDKMSFLKAPHDFLSVVDYAYYPQNSVFERAERSSLFLSIDGDNALSHLPVSTLTESDYFNYNGTTFGNFTFMHAILRIKSPNADISPAFLTVFDDDTYCIDAFNSNIKTTFYRKINEISKMIEKGNIKEVCFISLYTITQLDSNVSSISKNRVLQSESDILVCASIDNALNEKEYVFLGDKISCPKYIGYVLKHEMKTQLQLSRRNMFPIWLAFKSKNDNDTIE